MSEHGIPQGDRDEMTIRNINVAGAIQVHGEDGRTLLTIDPATGTVTGELADASEAARAFARALCSDWKAATEQARAEERERIAEAIENGPHRLGHNVSVVCRCLRCEVAEHCARIAREGGRA